MTHSGDVDTRFCIGDLAKRLVKTPYLAFDAIGSSRPGPSFRGLCARRETGFIDQGPGSVGFSIRKSPSASLVAGSSQAAKSVGARMTGMRSCMSRPGRHARPCRAQPGPGSLARFDQVPV